uniref:CRISPR system single-strand-specific deoxyribonuclease Cas10/Csm1 (subtype III-A) n=1 Tax=candidate division WOR-3 bacterium TaxID=2052148 RepID=A0A7C4GH30_UNCW3
MNSDGDRDFQTVVLAALLHDIGKFAQRTGRHPGRSHPELSSWFASEYLGNEWKQVSDAVGYHHVPAANSAHDPRLALTLVLADWMSSGERRPLPEGETGEPASDALITIFSRLGNSHALSCYPLGVLREDGRLEPSPDITAGQVRYQQLWDSFVVECKAMRRDDFGLLVDQMLAVLEKYTMFVPSAVWRSETDISLYHHLKSTAAIASCLYHDGLDAAALSEQLAAFESPDSSGRAVAHLVGGDVSGIQDFIYNLRAKGALKGLRGRSFYLQLLPEAVAGLVLDEFGLTRANLLYCGGGHFYALIPATPDIESHLADIGRRVDKTLLAAHGGRLGVAFASQELKPRDLGRENFGKAWDNLHARLAREKKRRFSRLLAQPDDVGVVLGPSGSGGEKSACLVCGDETVAKGPDGNPLCSMCASFADLGSSLKEATVLVESRADGRVEHPRTLFDVLANVGREYRFERRPGHEGSAWLLNCTDFVQQGLNGFRFVAKHVPQQDGATAELEDIAGQADGIRRWGVLRMDVDNLGETFKEALKPDRSISRLSVLSYLLHYFFTARVQALSELTEFRDKVYLAYSGGDDLFVIGAWSVLPKFAKRIRDEFREFTSERLDVSAGIFVAPSVKFPVYEAADLAGEAEGTSKREGRSRLTFLGKTLEWHELPFVEEVKAELVGLLNQGLPRAILSILNSARQQAAQATKEAGEGKTPMVPIWRLLYALKRMKERHDRLAQGIQKVEDGVRQGEMFLHPHLDLIVRWAEFETRRKDAEQAPT